MRLVPGYRLKRLGDRLDTTGIFQGREVSRVSTEIGRANNAAHDLGTTRLGQLADKEHAVRTNRPTHGLRHAVNQLLAQAIAHRLAWP